jgi:ATP-dependent Lon protease
LAPTDVDIDDGALRLIAGEHTREAGVRQLERAIARVLRKVTTALAAEPSGNRVLVTADSLVRYLGRPRFTPESAERTAVPGVATGLAVTGAGGDVLFVEATSMPGDAKLTLTGQLGDVMKESAHIALSYLKAHGDALGIDPAGLDRALHVHVPAGAIPKDGPSAGVTMVTALASLASGRPVRADVGMTGEVTLNGRVLPIGGVKQKLLAAHRAATRQTSTTCRPRSGSNSTCGSSPMSPTSSAKLSSRARRRSWLRDPVGVRPD